ncbi:MAG: hypothetical protein CVU89_14335 [Firmicutes bacterium HGW-Firmicutes-14]|jgi:DNA-binding NtrC family response regulator|nr:MAG: hypothetical protein CVU89_14335 [Firmicutes bacterium HGW-Firmicutes-14]
MAHVLVIEDDDVVRELLREVLGRTGYRVTEARNGLEGVQLFFRDPAEVVLIDVRHEHECFQSAREITERHPNTKIINMTCSRGKKFNSLDISMFLNNIHNLPAVCRPA